jgi:hypothetical protein
VASAGERETIAAVGVANQAVVPGAKGNLPPASAVLKTVAKTVANPEVAASKSTVAKTVANDDEADDLMDSADRGKSAKITEIGKGWRLEWNSDGRLRWRWQVKDDAGQTVTYQKQDGTLGYARGSRYVGITQSAAAQKEDRKRRRAKSAARRGGATGGKHGRGNG